MEEDSSLVVVPLEKPDSLNLSTERLVDTFEMVETPKSVMSLASNDSLHQPPPEQMTEGGWGDVEGGKGEEGTCEGVRVGQKQGRKEKMAEGGEGGEGGERVQY